MDVETDRTSTANVTADGAREAVARDWTAFTELLTAGGDTVWDRPTRLAGWTVEDLARHTYWGLTLEAEGLLLAVRAVGAGEVAPEDARNGRASARATGRRLPAGRAGTVAALQDARAELLSALERAPADLDTAVPMPYGDLALGFALQVFVMEAALHRSDLAHAVGADDRLAPGTHGPAANVLQAIWPTMAAAATAAPPVGTCVRLAGESVSVSAEYDGAAWVEPSRPPDVLVEGDDDAVLLLGYGRLDADDPRLRVSGRRDLAARLKEFVPGP